MLGSNASEVLVLDPRHLGFTMARYKFAAKMLAGKGYVLDVGTGDGFGIPILLQEVEEVWGLDCDKGRVNSGLEYMAKFPWAAGRYRFLLQDMVTEGLSREFDGAVCLDCIEHVDSRDLSCEEGAPLSYEGQFMRNLVGGLKDDGVLVMGTPNAYAARFQSEASAKGHVNLKDFYSLRALMKCYFVNVFMFGMNDEVVHTGFPGMCHYLIAVGAGVKR